MLLKTKPTSFIMIDETCLCVKLRTLLKNTLLNPNTLRFNVYEIK